MPDQNILTLRQADKARTDFALIEGNLEFIAGQLARVPTRPREGCARDHLLLRCPHDPIRLDRMALSAPISPGAAGLHLFLTDPG
jgi:hypothetical protein